MNIFHWLEVPGLFTTLDYERQSSYSFRDGSQSGHNAQTGCPVPLQTLQQAWYFWQGYFLHQAAPLPTGHPQGNDLNSMHDGHWGKQNPKSSQQVKSWELCVLFPSQELQDCEGQVQGIMHDLKSYKKKKLLLQHPSVGRGNSRTYLCFCNLSNCSTSPSVASLYFRGTRLKHCPLKMLHVPAPSFRLFNEKGSSEHQIKTKVNHKHFLTFLINHGIVTLPSQMPR